MLSSLTDLENYAIHATDGAIGHVKDFYFDDEAWVVRYAVVETGSWLLNRKVLISPIAFGQPNAVEKVLPVSITTEQVKHSPDIDTDKPVSRQHERLYLGYYGYPDYWGGSGLWGASAFPGSTLSAFAYSEASAQYRRVQVEHDAASDAIERHRNDDRHLRSCNEVVKYHILANDGEIGHVSGLLVDEKTCAIRYVIVNTSNWWLGHQVLVAPQWIQDVNWAASQVMIDLTKQAVKDAPPFNAAAQLNREQELGIFKHYGRNGYWINERKHETTETV